jgi:dTDP-4-amino-4,6-dideoxygalactose transaminase
MKIPFLDLSRLHVRQLDSLNQIFSQTLLNDRLSGGASVKAFEDNFAAYLGVPYCVSCANGTDALEIILRALNIGPGDEVIVPANGWLSAAEMVKLVGARPVFVDIDPYTYNMGLSRVEAVISSKTKAIMPIHLYGLPMEMPALMNMADKHGLYVIEDCAQAHGSHIHGKMSGSWGHAGAFSFYPTKNLGAIGDAGAIVTADARLAEKCHMIANHGQSTRDEHQVLGRNSRMDSLQAAVLNFRLEQLYACNVQRRLLARLYHEHLQDLPLTLPHEKEGFFHVYHLFVISTRERDALRTFLGEKGIGTLIHYPVAVSDMAHLNPSPAPLASQLSQKILSLPLYPEMTEEEILEVCQAIRKYFEG